jgi:hypothetical protein
MEPSSLKRIMQHIERQKEEEEAKCQRKKQNEKNKRIEDDRNCNFFHFFPHMVALTLFQSWLGSMASAREKLQ